MTGMRDLHDLPVSTPSTAALEAYDRGADALLGWDARALEHFETGTRHDPGLALAHAGTAVCHFLDERFEEARAAAEAARGAAAGQSERERRHVEAMALLVTGKVREAEAAMREHLDAHPRDLLVFQRLYYIWFWQGRFPEMLGLSTALTRWSPGNAYMLGMHAFALEEAGRSDEAVRVARAALVANPRDAWAIHALAHGLYEMAAFESGLRVLPPCIEPCTHLNWFRNHLLWHVTLMHFAAGEYARASQLGREVFETAPSSIAGNLHDSISLLWRLQLVGVDVKDRWAPFVEIARARLNRQGLLFHAAHLAMALAAGGDWATGDKQLAGLRERAPKDRTGLTGAVLVPLIEGLRAFAAGDYRTAIAAIEPLRPRIVELGGSRAQRDVFHDTLLEACFRTGDLDRAERLLVDRLIRRPDHWWRTRRQPAAA
jgi:tetratricopeptide (TPR) repeat protein